MQAAEAFSNLVFPAAGVNRARAFANGSPRQLADGSYAYATRSCQNVRATDPESGRIRGGNRPGLAKYISSPVVADWVVQSLDVLVVVSPAAVA